MTTASDPGSGRENGLQSVERAIDALELIAAAGSARVGEVAEAAGIHKSTASRLLAVLHQRNLVEPDGPRGTYRLGAGVLRLAAGMGRSWDLTDAGAAICATLAEKLGETVNIAVRRDDVVINVHQATGGGTVTVDNWVGRPTPLHATSSGKVLLAFGSRSGLPASRPAHTAETITDLDELIAELDGVRERGWAATAGELEVGLAAVAAPIRRGDGTVIAALSVSGPIDRLGPDRHADVARQIVIAATEIGSALGHLG